MPEVSVVIPLYNKAPYIEAALRSVQAQTFQDLEIIVVDDGSTDGGAALVERFDDPRIVLLRQANAGAGAARNTAIAAARGRWVAFLDADDFWQPDRLARQLQVLEAHPDLLWAAGAFLSIPYPGRLVSNPAVHPRFFATAGVIEDALALLAAQDAVWTSAVLVQRDLLRAVGGFDPALRVAQDVDLWVLLAVRQPRLAYVQLPIAVKRRVAGSLTVLSDAEGFSTGPERARRWAEMAKALPPERSGLLRGLARRSVDHTARREFGAGRPRKAREVLSVLPLLDLGRPSWRVRIAARLPDPVLPLLLSGRRMIRRWLARAADPPPPAHDWRQSNPLITPPSPRGARPGMPALASHDEPTLARLGRAMMPNPAWQPVADATADRDDPPPARPFLIELIGPPGAGKSSLLRELRARGLAIIPLSEPGRAPLACQLLKLTPLLISLFLREHRKICWSMWRELRPLARINALHHAIAKHLSKDGIVIIVYGPFLQLSYLRRSTSSITRSEAFGQHLRSLHELRSRMTTMAVWLDAEDHLLLQRIDRRSKPHPFKGKTLKRVSASFAAIRTAYSHSTENSTRLVRLDTSNASVCEIGQRVVEAIQLVRSRCRTKDECGNIPDLLAR